jgi:hypothetical protein
MPDEPPNPPPEDAMNTDDKSAEAAAAPAASSALQGHVDYVELTERVALGVTVRMPDVEATSTPDIQPSRSTDGATSTAAPEGSTLDTNEFDANG